MSTKTAPKVATLALSDLLAYPDIQKFDSIPEIVDQFVYVVKAYSDKGIAVLIQRKDDHVYY